MPWLHPELEFERKKDQKFRDTGQIQRILKDKNQEKNPAWNQQRPVWMSEVETWLGLQARSPILNGAPEDVGLKEFGPRALLLQVNGCSSTGTPSLEAAASRTLQFTSAVRMPWLHPELEFEGNKDP
ncbi:hypothetical protein DUI87_24709 [Hirundo rustica rustica]|uniref:Uncharacterized protein n=1 Tax=Hirundo rustica rustica TaxID=333673 RepID=A0A3M0JC12_HIRRU|nr:hypothetical protein DUI87_24709 [Hirundo rustica rustica]